MNQVDDSLRLLAAAFDTFVARTLVEGTIACDDGDQDDAGINRKRVLRKNLAQSDLLSLSLGRSDAVEMVADGRQL
jgi:hypothetical protein